MLKAYFLITIGFFFLFNAGAQQGNCVLKPPAITIHFGTGNVHDVNTEYLQNYDRLSTSCPPDGYYSYKSFTSDCFGGDWHTLMEDHTPGDIDGNMLLVNGAPRPGVFFKTIVMGLKGGTTYEIGMWLMNLCKPSDKCPFPLLPNLNIRLETEDGRAIANIVTGELTRVPEPHWTQHRAMFTTPASVTAFTLVMSDATPGGCGNDFALDDITFRECVKIPPPVTTVTKPTLIKPKSNTSDKKLVVNTSAPKKSIPVPVAREIKTSQVAKPKTDSAAKSIAVVKQIQKLFPPPPLVLTTRENALVKRIEAEAGEIKIELYDNGEIDGDTVTIYHNNKLIKSHAGLSQKPISFSIPLDESHPHHELIMVADNLGSIPPNTSVMIVTAGSSRYEVFISSSEQKNAKVVLDLKK